MRLEMIGMNHRTSSIEVREKAAIGLDRLQDALHAILDDANVDGAVVLSTCNRLELYLSPQIHTPEERLRELLTEITDLSREEVGRAYIKQDLDAVEHLFRVAAGLDSMMVGEKQILGQVKDAYQAALNLSVTNSILNKLFLRAIECGKYIHHNTAISQGAVSVAGAAVQLAGRIHGDLKGRRVLLVGAGETARLTARHLVSAGVTSWRISNRTESNAEAVADLLGGTTTSFPPAADDILWADLIISATASPEPVITAPSVRQAIKKRQSSLLILDLAVPRNVEPVIADLQNTFLYTVDDFKEMVSSTIKLREQEAVRAEKYTVKSTVEFDEWYKANRIAPTIQQVQASLEAIRVRELENNIHRFSEEDHEQADKFSRTLIKKITNLFISNLRRVSLEGDDLASARVLSQLLASSDDDNANRILEKLERELSH